MPKIELKKINNVEVKGIPLLNAKDDRPAKGANLFPFVFGNIFVVAPTNSGKTSLIYKVMKECIDSRTTVIVFSSTINNDKSWETIKKYLKLKTI
jgi:Ni2+-binding GTPase involved in maturation of urease and hydrogenase